MLPCSPACANWLRYGIQPKNPGPGLHPGHCPSKAHDRECLGLGGRRALVSRYWTGKTLTQHKADRAEVVRQVLAKPGIEAPDADRLAADVLHSDGKPRFVWEDTQPDQRDYPAMIAASLRQAKQWRTQYEHAKTIAAQRGSPPGDLWTVIQQSADRSPKGRHRQGEIMNEKLLYRVCGVAEYLSLSRSKTYELIRAGVVPSVKIDGVRRVRGVDLLAYVESLGQVA